MENLLTFKEFVSQRREFNYSVHLLWIDCFTNQHITLTDQIIQSCFDSKYSSVSKLKKLLKSYAFPYTKEKGSITLSKELLQFVLTTHGNDEIKKYITELPFFVYRYEQYINEQKLSYMSMRFQ